jgi:hypothetical protein
MPERKMPQHAAPLPNQTLAFDAAGQQVEEGLGVIEGVGNVNAETTHFPPPPIVPDDDDATGPEHGASAEVPGTDSQGLFKEPEYSKAESTDEAEDVLSPTERGDGIGNVKGDEATPVVVGPQESVKEDQGNGLFNAKSAEDKELISPTER